MKLLRFLLLLGTVSAVYLAQQILAYRPLADLLTPDLLRLLPALSTLPGWSIEEQRTVALLTAAVAALLFGLVVQPWRRAVPHVTLPHAKDEALPQNDDREKSTHRSVSTTGIVLLSLGLLLSLGCALLLGLDRPESLWLQVSWAAGIVLFLLGLTQLRSGGTADEDSKTENSKAENSKGASPESSWPQMVFLLVVAGLLFAWQLSSVPLRVDGDPASHGLQAMLILSGQESRIFAPGWANIPLIAYYPAALGMLFSGDWLLGNRLAGVYAGLLTLFGVWLLGCELFRRPWLSADLGDGADRPPVQDDGRLAALLALAVTAIGYTFIHFSRLPQYMEPVAWGTVGLSALLRGMRTRSMLLLGLSGLLLGLAGVLYYSGRIFAIVGGIWWIFYWVRRSGESESATIEDAPGNVTGRNVTGRNVPGSASVKTLGFGLWAGGGILFAAPFAGYWLRSPISFYARASEVSIFGADQQIHMAGVYGVDGLTGILWKNIERVLLTFNLYADTSTHFGFPGPMLDQLIGPLLILGAGVLLLNLDRVLSWRLLSWLAVVLLFGGIITINAPFWPRLLPALPVVGLIIAFGMDRLRATLYTIGGPWLRYIGTLLLASVLVLAAAHNWIGYYAERTVYADPPTHTGRALRLMPDDRVAYLFQVEGEFRPRWDDRIVQYLGGLPYRPIQQQTIDPADGWPATVPPKATFFLQPGDTGLAIEVESRYPDGIYRIQRDRLGNPVLILYELP